MRNWTALRETYGEIGDSAHPVGRLLAAQPDLRALLPSELSQRLGVALEQAQKGILTLAAECFPPGSSMPAGEAFDSLVVLAGRPMRPVELVGEGANTSTRPAFLLLANVFRV